jgi:two-component system, LytTR family, sensor kinase
MKAMILRMSAALIFGHVLFWLLYIASEYFANRVHMMPGHEWEFFKSIFLTLPALLIPTYFITLFVVPRYLITSKWPQFILWIVLVAIIIFYARIKWAELIIYFESGTFYKIPVDKLLKNIIRDYAIIALAVCISIIGDYRRSQQRNEQLYRAKAEAEIKLLKGQLHPHFLFNSLNNIYSLALSRSDRTADSILKLTGLLEYLLYRASQDKVLLSKEVELLHHYIDLERLRYGDKLKIETDIALHQESLYVAPLILLPFAENCFKHGGAGADGIFRIVMQLRTDEKTLIFRITNSKRKNNKTRSETANGGIGLNNILQRLELLYPNRYRLEIKEEAETYSVHLIIALRNEEV